jgi:hypothetical protein
MRDSIRSLRHRPAPGWAPGGGYQEAGAAPDPTGYTPPLDIPQHRVCPTTPDAPTRFPATGRPWHDAPRSRSEAALSNPPTGGSRPGGDWRVGLGCMGPRGAPARCTAEFAERAERAHRRAPGGPSGGTPPGRATSGTGPDAEDAVWACRGSASSTRCRLAASAAGRTSGAAGLAAAIAVMMVQPASRSICAAGVCGAGLLQAGRPGSACRTGGSAGRRAGCCVPAMVVPRRAAALAGVRRVSRGFGSGSRFKGSVREDSKAGFCPGVAAGSRFKGSVRNGLNGAVEAGFAVGSRFKGSVPDGLNGTVGVGFAAGSRFKGSVRDGLNGAVGPGIGAACGGRMAGPQIGGAGGKLAFRETVTGVARDRDWRVRQGLPVRIFAPRGPSTRAGCARGEVGVAARVAPGLRRGRLAERAGRGFCGWLGREAAPGCRTPPPNLGPLRGPSPQGEGE